MAALICDESSSFARGASMRMRMDFFEVVVGFAACGASQKVGILRVREHS